MKTFAVTYYLPRKQKEDFVLIKAESRYDAISKYFACFADFQDMKYLEIGECCSL